MTLSFDLIVAGMTGEQRLNLLRLIIADEAYSPAVQAQATKTLFAEADRLPRQERANFYADLIQNDTSALKIPATKSLLALAPSLPPVEALNSCKTVVDKVDDTAMKAAAAEIGRLASWKLPKAERATAVVDMTYCLARTMRDAPDAATFSQALENLTPLYDQLSRRDRQNKADWIFDQLAWAVLSGKNDEHQAEKEAALWHFMSDLPLLKQAKYGCRIVRLSRERENALLEEKAVRHTLAIVAKLPVDKALSFQKKVLQDTEESALKIEAGLAYIQTARRLNPMDRVRALLENTPRHYPIASASEQAMLTTLGQLLPLVVQEGSFDSALTEILRIEQTQPLALQAATLALAYVETKPELHRRYWLSHTVGKGLKDHDDVKLKAQLLYNQTVAEMRQRGEGQFAFPLFVLPAPVAPGVKKKAKAGVLAAAPA